MCHFCHVLGKNLQAPQHRSTQCFDKANSYSKVPMNKRTHENGIRIVKSNSNKDHSICLDTVSNSIRDCTICLDNLSNIVFIPCGHVATCESCSSEISACPICRATITSRQKIYPA